MKIFKADNEKVRFYTGFTNWNLLLINLAHAGARLQYS